VNVGVSAKTLTKMTTHKYRLADLLSIRIPLEF